MKKQILFLLGMLLLIVINLSAQAQERGERKELAMNKMDKKERMIAKLELTEAQQTQMENLKVDHHKEVQPLRNELRLKKVTLASLTTSPSIDQKKVDRTIDAIGGLETKLLKAKTNHKIAMRSLLNDKQKMIFDHMKEKGGKKGGGHNGLRGK